jgi:hypothetical protein
VIAPAAIGTSEIARIRALHAHGEQGELGEFSSFLGALPGRFHLRRRTTYPGFIPVSVYTFEDGWGGPALRRRARL